MEKHWVRLAAMGDAQHGVLAAWQLHEIGTAYSVIAERATRGHLFRIHQGVYAVGRRNLTTKGHWMAAVLACGPDAYLSHRTAAALHGIRQTSQRKVDVTTAGWRPDRRTIRIHSSTLHAEDVAKVDSLPTTSIARTIVDLAPILTHDQLARVIEEAERRQVFDLTPLRRAMARRPRAFNLVVELDGRAYHTTARAFERDRERDAILLRHGIRVLRITYRRLAEDPAEVIADLNALTRAAA